MASLKRCNTTAVWVVNRLTNKMEQHLFVFLIVASCCCLISCVELTFELEDNARECFHENIVNKTKCTLEFQVKRKFFSSF